MKITGTVIENKLFLSAEIILDCDIDTFYEEVSSVHEELIRMSYERREYVMSKIPCQTERSE